jgi:hypothetical protein
MTLIQRMEALRHQRRRSLSLSLTPDQELHYKELLAQRRERVRELVSEGRVISPGAAQSTAMAKRKAQETANTSTRAVEDQD